MISDAKLVIGTDVSIAATAADVLFPNQIAFKIHDLGAGDPLALHVHVKTSIAASTATTVSFNLGTAAGFYIASTGPILVGALLANTHWFARLNPWPQADPSNARVPGDSDVLTLFCLAVASAERASGAAKGNMVGTVTVDIVKMPSISARTFPAVQY